MSEHVFTVENLAAYVAGGLDAAERERLELHARECFNCASALESARAADRRLLSLFGNVRPEPAFEDRLIRSLRDTAVRKRSTRASMRMPLWMKVTIAAAAAILLIAGGAAITAVLEGLGPLQMAKDIPDERNAALSPDPFATTSYGLDKNKWRTFWGEEDGKKGHGLAVYDSSASLSVKDGTSNTVALLEKENGDVASAEELAQQIRKQSLFALVDDGRQSTTFRARVQSEAKQNMKVEGLDTINGTGTMAEYDRRFKELRTFDGDPASKREEALLKDVKELTGKIPDVSVPGSLKPNDEVGVKDKLKDGQQWGALPPAVPVAPATTQPPPPPGEGGRSYAERPGGGPGKSSGGSASLSKTPAGDQAGKQTEEIAKLIAKHREVGGEKMAMLHYFKPGDGFSKAPDGGKEKGDDKKDYDKESRPGESKTGDKQGQGKGEGEPNKRTTDNPKGNETNKQGPPLVSSGPGAPGTALQKPEPPPEPVVQKIIIRSGDIEFEVKSFDDAVEIVQAMVAAIKDKGAFVATINSDKLPNGKMYGSVVVRVPPILLDEFVLGLRKKMNEAGGALKSQKIGSREITKEYTDLQSRLKAARTMEERLINIIKTGKGEIKDLLLAEKELGVWRTKIEEITGELNYYSNLVALSTLTIHFTEKEIRVAAAVTESERVQANVEVEDVEKAMRELLKAVDDAKGRVTRSEMKQQSAGQFTAILQFETAPEKAGPVFARLKQLGTLARMDVDRVQETDGGTLPNDGKLIRGNTKFYVSLYNLYNITPRETITVRVFVSDAAAAYRELREAVTKANGRILDANVSEQDRQNLIAHIDFDVRRTDEAAIHEALKMTGEVLGRQVVRAPAGVNVTDTKVLFRVDLVANVPARETVVLRLTAIDVPAAYTTLRDAVAKAKGRVINSSLNEQDRQNIGAQLDFDIRRTEEAAIQQALTTAGEVLSRSVTRLPESDAVTDTKVAFKVEFAANIGPRDTVTVRLAALDVPAAYAALRETVTKAKGRVVDAKLNEQDPRNVGAQLDFEVRRSEEGAIQIALTAGAEVLSRHLARLPDSSNVTDAKVMFRVEFAANVQPRETVTLKIAAVDVAAAHRALRNSITQAKGRLVNANLDEKDRQNVAGVLDFDLRRTEEGVVQTALNESGAVLSRHVARTATGENLTDSRVFFKVELVPAAAIDPREVHVLAVEVNDVDKEIGSLSNQVKEMGGRLVKGPLTAQERNGRVTAHVTYDVPLVMASTLVDKIRATGQVRVSQVAPNPQAPEGKLALARIDVTFANADVLTPGNEGFLTQIGAGLSFCLKAMFVSLKFLLVGLLAILPWALVIFAIVWVVRRSRGSQAPTVTLAAVTPAGEVHTPPASGTPQ